MSIFQELGSCRWLIRGITSIAVLTAGLPISF